MNQRKAYMLFNLNNLVVALSHALDFMEIDFLGGVTYHSRRVAYIALRLAEQFELTDQQRFDLVTLAILHDNGIGAAFQPTDSGSSTLEVLDTGTRHCTAGEENLRGYPFLTNCPDVIKYHHENADGSGLFHLTAKDTPLMARIIHLADLIELRGHPETIDYDGKKNLFDWLEKQKGVIIESDLVDAFRSISQKPAFWLDLKSDFVSSALHRAVPAFALETEMSRVREVTHIFSRIIDSKSRFTRLHSQELSERTGHMAEHYSYSADEISTMRIAADLHDVGKLAISNSILDKPGKLDPREIDQIQRHTYYTRISLQSIEGFEDITEWAANHHEKIDGTGYPYRRPGDSLDFNARLLGCLDIYQALTEVRPYREALSHTKSISIMKEMSGAGKIDPVIVDDIDRVFA